MLSEQQQKDIKFRYYAKKKRCPCGSLNLAETSIQDIPVLENRDFRDVKNKTFCNECQRYWYIDQLKS